MPVTSFCVASAAIVALGVLAISARGAGPHCHLHLGS